MAKDLRKKCIITAALSGATSMKSQNECVPYTSEEFADEAKKCYDLGTSIIHLHARDPQTGLPTHNLSTLREIIDTIKESCPDIIINISSGMSFLASPKDRVKLIKEIRPEIASIFTDSMNFAIGDWSKGDLFAEVIYGNSFSNIQRYAKAMLKTGTQPELEVYNIAGLYNILFLMKQDFSYFKSPLQIQFMFGNIGGVPFTPGNFASCLERMPKDSNWSAGGIGQDHFKTVIYSIANGGHVRVGLEDTIKNVRGELANGSSELVAWAAKMIRLYGREIASPLEAREILLNLD